MKARRHAAILRLVHEHDIPSQERLRELLAEAGHNVTQATLSRDVHDLGLIKSADADGAPAYAAPREDLVPSPQFAPLVRSLLLRVDGVGSFLVLRTPAGSASALTAALDHEDWPEVLGSIAGDDTVLLICKTVAQRERLAKRIMALTDRR